MTRVLHLVNQTPIEWYCKKQPTVATVMYSFKFIATQSMTDQIIDLWCPLHMMGVPLDYHSYVIEFWDFTLNSSSSRCSIR